MKDNSDWISTFEKYYSLKFKHNKNDVFYINPLYIGLKITENCNQKCIHCWAGKSNFIPTFRQITKFMDNISLLNPMLFGISGGEPFLHKDIFNIIEYATSKFFSIEILTNGTLLTQDYIKKLKKYMRNSDWIHFSLDGINNIYNKQRGANDYNKVLVNLKNLLKSKLNIRVHMTVTPINVNDIQNVYKLISDLGVKNFSITYVYPLRKGEKFFKGDYEKTINLYKNEVRKILVTNRNTDINIKYFLPIECKSLEAKKSKNNMSVNRIFNTDVLHWTIDVDGDIYNFMDYNKFSELKIGNIYKDNFDNILQNNKIVQNKIIYRNLQYDACKNCSIFYSCGGGEFINSYPNIFVKDKRCKFEPK